MYNCKKLVLKIILIISDTNWYNFTRIGKFYSVNSCKRSFRRINTGVAFIGSHEQGVVELLFLALGLVGNLVQHLADDVREGLARAHVQHGHALLLEVIALAQPQHGHKRQLTVGLHHRVLLLGAVHQRRQQRPQQLGLRLLR